MLHLLISSWDSVSTAGALGSCSVPAGCGVWEVHATVDDRHWTSTIAGLHHAEGTRSDIQTLNWNTWTALQPAVNNTTLSVRSPGEAHRSTRSWFWANSWTLKWTETSVTRCESYKFIVLFHRKMCRCSTKMNHFNLLTFQTLCQLSNAILNLLIQVVKTNMPWAVRLSWLENVYLRPLLGGFGDFLQQSRSHWPGFWCAMRVHWYVCACNIRTVWVQVLGFVPPLLTKNLIFIFWHVWPE